MLEGLELLVLEGNSPPCLEGVRVELLVLKG